MKKSYLFVCLALLTVNAAFADSFYPNTKASKNCILETPKLYSNYMPRSVEPSFSVEVFSIQKQVAKNPKDMFLRLKLAKAYERNGNILEAIDEYNNILSSSKNNPQILNALAIVFQDKVSKNKADYSLLTSLGAIYQAQGKLDEAMTAYKKALMLNPSNQTTRLNIATVYQLQNNPEKALPIYESYLLSSPYDTEVRINKAECLLDLGRISDAAGEYKMVLQQQPSNTSVKMTLYELIKPYSTQDEVIKVLYPEYRNKLVDSEAYCKMAVDLKKADKNDDAIFFYKLVVNTDQSNATAYVDMADIYSKQDKKDLARDAMEVAHRIIPEDVNVKKKYDILVAATSVNPLQEALKLTNNGLYDEAIVVYESVSPKTAEVFTGIASCYQFLNKPEEALKYLNKALELEPQSSEVFYAFAFLAVNQEDFAKAQAYAEKSLTLNPDNLKSQKLLNFISQQECNKLLDQIFSTFDNKKYNETLRLIGQVLKIDSKNSDAYYYKGLVLAAQKKHQYAIIEFQNAINSTNDYPLAYYSLGNSYDALAKYNDSLVAYKKYISLIKEENEYSKYARERVLDIEKK